MIWKDFKYKWQSISRTTTDYRVGLDVVNWKWLDTTDQTDNVQGYHWIKVSPTYARWRRIVIEWVIVADTKENSSKAIDYLESLFALQWITNEVELNTFTVTDEQERTWEINAKIKEPLEIELADDDYIAWANRRFRIVLQSEDPRYFSDIEKESTWVESRFGWVKLGVKLPTKLDDNLNEIQVIANWNIVSPLEFTITAKWDIDTPLYIKNITDGTYFWLDINAVAGDVIVINSDARTATKNWVNILANRIAGSTWLKALGSNYFTIYDYDWWLAESDFDVKILYKDILL